MSTDNLIDFADQFQIMFGNLYNSGEKIMGMGKVYSRKTQIKRRQV